MRAQVAPAGAIEPDLLEREQHAVHGLAWLATYVEALRQIHAWAQRLGDRRRLGELERLMLRAASGEYLARIAGGIPMSQGETARLHQMYLDAAAISAFADDPAVRRAVATARRRRCARAWPTLIADGRFGDWGLEDDTLDMVREQFSRFAEEQIVPHAHGWHAKDALIPLEVIEALAGLGVFGLTVPEAWGGLGMGKAAMCVVTEELSRGYIGVGSLGTRSEIAAELIRLAGTDAQKASYLPRIASGEDHPDGGVHRAQHRLRPRLAADARGSG